MFTVDDFTDIVARAGNTTIPGPDCDTSHEGNDGPWSTFNLRVGTPEQYVRVLISTASPETLVVLSQYGCSPSAFTEVPVNCPSSRGIMFNQNASLMWKDQGFFGINDGIEGLEANLGYVQATEVGLDTLGLGLVAGGNGPTLQNQIVAGITSASPFYLGIFGLNTQPVNLSTLGNSSSPSYFQSLKNENLIPSLSWSCTAGARYRLKQVYGQLILGGYDASRFISNSVSFDLARDTTRNIVVALQSISYNGSTQSSLLNSSILTFIDSTDPNIWLPETACQAFESAFGLTLDKTSGLYLVNDSLHTTLVASNPSISFTLSDSLTDGQTVTISLPYSTFDLTASIPLVTNSSSYFPLRQAANSTQYTLGRTFLQEAYLTVDYELGNFSVSQCSWVDGAAENIITINSKDYVSPSSSSSNNIAAIASVVISLTLLLSLAAGAFFFLWRRKQRMSGIKQLLGKDSKYHEDHELEVLSKKYGELSNDSQIYQLHSEPKGFEGQEIHADPREKEISGMKMGVGIHELMGNEVRSAELDAGRGRRGCRA